MFAPLLLAALNVPAPLELLPGSPMPQVGSQVLLTLEATAGPNGQVVRATPELLNAAGQPVPRAPWLNRPLKVIRKTEAAYVLASDMGRDYAYLPRRSLEKKAVFPLYRSAQTQRLNAQLLGRRVWFNGHPTFACELAEGYHASVTADSAEVSGVWEMNAAGLNISPQGGLVDGGLLLNERQARAPLLVMLSKPQKPHTTSASMNGDLESQSSRLMTQTAQRCPTLPAVYADLHDLRRNLTKARPPRPAIPFQRATPLQTFLVGKTRAQILAAYGNPNEEGTLENLLALPEWHYGEVPYNRMTLQFDKAGRVSAATIAQSP